MPLLSQYITEARRLLHDATGNFWSDTELTDYINDARNRVVSDTGCNRILQSLNITTGQETYSYASLPQGNSTIDVLNVTIIWGNQRIPLDWMVFSDFNSKIRVWSNQQSRPFVFSTYGQNTVYIGPIPDQTYPAEWDTVVLPASLTSDSSPEVLLYPYTSPVAYYAAYKAKIKEQSMKEAEEFEQMYKAKVLEALRSTFTRRIPSMYR